MVREPAAAAAAWSIDKVSCAGEETRLTREVTDIMSILHEGDPNLERVVDAATSFEEVHGVVRVRFELKLPHLSTLMPCHRVLWPCWRYQGLWQHHG